MKNTLNEIWQFLGALYGGFIIGILYRIFSLMRLPFPNKWVNAALDILFYALAGAAAAFTLLTVNGGEIRLFILMSMGLGIWIFISCSRNLIKYLFEICKKLLVKQK
ncbi:MAG: spore cortex biosynthesis protein YabQ [Clostridia bacterium]|nr:spore cortex biosynthesis protein YabQ [Clostridia bacterium]